MSWILPRQKSLSNKSSIRNNRLIIPLVEIILKEVYHCFSLIHFLFCNRSSQLLFFYKLMWHLLNTDCPSEWERLSYHIASLCFHTIYSNFLDYCKYNYYTYNKKESRRDQIPVPVRWKTQMTIPNIPSISTDSFARTSNHNTWKY